MRAISAIVLVLAVLTGCSRKVPTGDVAQMTVTGSNQVELHLLPDKLVLAKFGKFRFFAALGTVAHSSDAKKTIDCEKVRSSGEESPAEVPIDPSVTLSHRMNNSTVDVRLGSSPVMLRCGPVMQGEVIKIPVLFFYEPASIFADADELNQVEVPIVVRGINGVNRIKEGGAINPIP